MIQRITLKLDSFNHCSNVFSQKHIINHHNRSKEDFTWSLVSRKNKNILESCHVGHSQTNTAVFCGRIVHLRLLHLLFRAHFFLPPLSSPSPLRSQLTTLPSITTPLPSMKATRERPSQFLKVSQTNGCCGWKLH